ncbi:hypothetical protein [Amycolatopsis sp. NPDC051071]|uniref:hypothetical protein n=1 Tax=Amycolatopsis sp. NPDC051071 TaxID=3154637 RepID=UPI003430EC9C
MRLGAAGISERQRINSWTANIGSSVANLFGTGATTRPGGLRSPRAVGTNSLTISLTASASAPTTVLSCLAV